MVHFVTVVVLTPSDTCHRFSYLIDWGDTSLPFFMEKDKLKLITRNLRLLVDALESEVNSDVNSYTQKLEETLPPLPDYDEVYEDDE